MKLENFRPINMHNSVMNHLTKAVVENQKSAKIKYSLEALFTGSLVAGEKSAEAAIRVVPTLFVTVAGHYLPESDIKKDLNMVKLVATIMQAYHQMIGVLLTALSPILGCMNNVKTQASHGNFTMNTGTKALFNAHNSEHRASETASNVKAEAVKKADEAEKRTDVEVAKAKVTVEEISAESVARVDDNVAAAKIEAERKAADSLTRLNEKAGSATAAAEAKAAELLARLNEKAGSATTAAEAKAAESLARLDANRGKASAEAKAAESLARLDANRGKASAEANAKADAVLARLDALKPKATVEVKQDNLPVVLVKKVKTSHIERLQKQMNSCGKGPRGRAKRAALALQIKAHRNNI